jgi:hypothetical protein
MNVTLASLGAQAASLVPRLAPTITAEAASSPSCVVVYAGTMQGLHCCTYSRCWTSWLDGRC